MWHNATYMSLHHLSIFLGFAKKTRRAKGRWNATISIILQDPQDWHEILTKMEAFCVSSPTRWNTCIRESFSRLNLCIFSHEQHIRLRIWSHLLSSCLWSSTKPPFPNLIQIEWLLKTHGHHDVPRAFLRQGTSLPLEVPPLWCNQQGL